MTTLYRCDVLDHRMNLGKEAQIWAALKAWRRAAPLAASEQWRLWFEDGNFDVFLTRPDFYHVAGGTKRGEAVRRQVVGILTGHIATVRDDYARVVEKSRLPEEVRHHLHIINRCHAWFRRTPIVLRQKAVDGSDRIIPTETQRLARSIMHHCLEQRRRPDVRRIGMTIGGNLARITDGEAPAQRTPKFPLWVRMSTLTKGHPIDIPLVVNSYALKRQGARRDTVQVIERGGRLAFGIITDVTETCAASRQAYVALTSEVALDFGLRTLFATDGGDLLGRNFLPRLQVYDRRITSLAASRQRAGLKVRSPRYDR